MEILESFLLILIPLFVDKSRQSNEQLWESFSNFDIVHPPPQKTHHSNTNSHESSEKKVSPFSWGHHAPGGNLGDRCGARCQHRPTDERNGDKQKEKEKRNQKVDGRSNIC